MRAFSGFSGFKAFGTARRAGGGSAPTTRIAGNRNRIYGPGNTSTFTSSSYIRHEGSGRTIIAPGGLQKVTAILSGKYLAPAVTAEPDCVYETGIVAGGSYAALTFSGATTVSVPGTSFGIVSDEITLAAPVAGGGTVETRTGLTLTLGQQLKPSAIRASADTFFSSNSPTSQVPGTAPMNIPSGGASKPFVSLKPVALLNTGANPVPSIMFVGDSKCAGDVAGLAADANGNVGFYERATALMAPGQIGVMTVARSGNTALNAAAVSQRQIWTQFLPYVDVVMFNLGINDLIQANSGNFTLLNIQANLTTMWALAKAEGKIVFHALISPRTSGTNVAANGSDQAYVARFGPGQDADLLNAWILARAADGTIDGAYDPPNRNANDPNKWIANYTRDNDLLHENATATAAIAPDLAAWLAARVPGWA